MNQAYAPQRRLVVTMPNGEVIDHQHGTDTFEEVIRKLGVERCEPHDSYIRHCSVGLPSSTRKEVRIGEYCVECGESTLSRKLRLEHIAYKLGIPLKVDTPLKH
jgi:hypothetical protein